MSLISAPVGFPKASCPQLLSEMLCVSAPNFPVEYAVWVPYLLAQPHVAELGVKIATWRPSASQLHPEA